MATRMHRGANDDAEFDYENDYNELEDFYSPIVGMAVELIGAGRLGENRPEDHVALKLSKSGAGSLTEAEMDIMNERLSPLAELYWRKDRSAFEVEFVRRRAPGFYDDHRQGNLFL